MQLKQWPKEVEKLWIGVFSLDKKTFQVERKPGRLFRKVKEHPQRRAQIFSIRGSDLLKLTTGNDG